MQRARRRERVVLSTAPAHVSVHQDFVSGFLAPGHEHFITSVSQALAVCVRFRNLSYLRTICVAAYLILI